MRLITCIVRPSNIIWTTAKFKPKIHHFNAWNSGIQADIYYSWKIIDYFQLFVGEKLIKYIAEKSNNYGRQKNDNKVIAGTSLNELFCFIAISFLMTKNKRLSLAEHWSKEKLLRSDIFGKVISRDYYLLLLQMLYFIDNHVSNFDCLHKICKIIDELQVKILLPLL